MTHNPHGDEALALETRLDALGRAMTAESQLVPIAFLGAVRHRRQAIAFKRIGSACAAAAALVVVVVLARYQVTRPAAGPSTLNRATMPTYANLRAVGDVNALPSPSVGEPNPLPRAGERPDAEVTKALTEFK